MSDEQQQTTTEPQAPAMEPVSTTAKVQSIFGALAGDGTQPAPTGTPEQEQSGTPESNAEQLAPDNSEADSGTAEASGGEEQQESASDVTPEVRQERELSRVALKRDGWTDDEITALEPAQLVAIGKRRQEAQQNFDRMVSQHSATKQELEELRAEHNITDEYDDPDIALVAETDPDLARRLAEKQAGLSDTSHQAEINEARETVRVAMTDLGAEYPTLDDPSVRERVISRTGMLANSGAYDDREAGPDLLKELIGIATRIELGEPNTQSAQKKLLESSQEQRNGQVDTSPSAITPQVSDDPEGDAFDALVAGKSTDEVKAQYNRSLAGATT